MGWMTTNHIPMFDDGTYNVVLVFVNIWRFPKHTYTYGGFLEYCYPNRWFSNF